MFPNGFLLNFSYFFYKNQLFFKPVFFAKKKTSSLGKISISQDSYPGEPSLTDSASVDVSHYGRQPLGCHFGVQSLWLPLADAVSMAATCGCSLYGCHLRVQSLWLPLAGAASMAATSGCSLYGCHLRVQSLWLPLAGAVSMAASCGCSLYRCHLRIYA